MEKLASILVAVERSDYVHRALAKAVILARHFGARLELFLCDAEHVQEFGRLNDPKGIENAHKSCLADGMRYLESLRQLVAAQDVSISLDVACESPLHEGVVRKVLRSCPDLVIKTARDNDATGQRGLTASDWQIVRTCPVPLMVTRGRPWQPQPRFAAAIDVSEEESPGMAQAILHTAAYLALGCNARLDMVYSDRSGREPPAQAGDAHERSLQGLAREFRIDAERVHVLHGDPGQTITRYAAEQGCDVLALGALTHRRTLSGMVGTLTGRLLDTLDCDFVLVKPESYVCPVRAQPLAPLTV